MELSLPPDDQLLGSAAQFLIDGAEEDAASVLLSCSMTAWESGDTWMSGDELLSAIHVALTGPRTAYEIISQSTHSVRNSIERAVEAVLPEEYYVKHLTASAELIDIDPDWREELLEIARGKGVHNQAVTARNVRIWKNLRFRSASEIKIAHALDRAGVLFFPNCLGRLGSMKNRITKEPDFLVCANGRWGILEVDGEPFHPASRAAQDHARDRLFREQGVRLFEHFDATECYERPGEIVSRFLGLLGKA